MSFVYTRASWLLGHNSTRINYLADTAIKMILVTSGYTANRDHDFVSSIGANELSGTGYVAGFNGSGRIALASKTITEDDTNDRANYGAANPTWTGINAGTVAAAIIVKEITNDAASELIAYLDGVAKVTNGGDLTVTLPGGVAFYLSTA